MPIAVLESNHSKQMSMENNMANKIILNNAIADDQWTLITDVNTAEIPTGKIIVPLVVWNKNAQVLSKRTDLPGLLLSSNEDPADFLGDIHLLKIIAVDFPVFTDGRGFSIGNLLRERYSYKGELRACGGFIRDQLYYLKRCGFNSFQFNNNTDLNVAMKSLQDFSNDYQISASQPSPLFRRRTSTP